MVCRDEILNEIQGNITFFQTGSWYIAEGEYDGLKSAAQGESEREAIESLINRFYKRAKRAENREQERLFHEQQKRRRELVDDQLDRIV